MKTWLLQVVIKFALKQVAKWQNSIDWAKVKGNVEKFVREEMPGEILDDEAVELCFSVLDAVAAALSASEDLEKIVKLCVDGKLEEAWQVLRELILKSWAPISGPEQKVYACVKDCESLAA